MPTPIYDALERYVQSGPARFHMPGHKGKWMPIPQLVPLAPYDVTEIGPTGDLFSPGEPFDTAQRLWAEEMGFQVCQLLTGGSTMGIHTALTLCCRPGEQLLVDRNCHRAVFNSMALLDLDPVYLQRPWLKEERLIGPLLPEDVEKMLTSHPDIKTVCITSPTYAGVLSDVQAIGAIVHAHGGKLFVDGAHGAHLHFLGLDVYRGADAVVMSAHKTLPAMGQTALLFTNGFEPDLVRLRASIYGTSSPSYPMLLSLDGALQWLTGPGRQEYARAGEEVARLRQRYPSLNSPELSLDPTRFTLKVKDGPAFSRRLEQLGIYPEMDDGGHVVFICTAQDQAADFQRLAQALDQLAPMLGDCPAMPAPHLPRQAASMRQALFSTSRVAPLEQCLGEVAACQIAPYPPGVPVVAPGEEIGKKELSYLEQIGYNMLSEVRVVCPKTGY